MGEIRFLGRARGGRCVYCHDSLAGSVQTCPECSATWHEDCGQGARRCPTTGCSGPAPGASSRRGRKRNWHRVLTPAAPPAEAEAPLARTGRPRPGFRARFGPYLRLLLSTLWNTAAGCAATAYLLWPLLSWASFWKHCSTGKNNSHNPAWLAAIFALFTLGVAVWGVFVTSRWLWKVPSVLREVASLLDDTHPTAMRLSVYSEGSGKHIRWFAKLVGGGHKLTLSLAGILPPMWLRQANEFVNQPVLVYGLPPPGPYVIEFRDGSLALVHPD